MLAVYSGNRRRGLKVMDFDSMFAGIEPGGMTDAYEIKILICYLLYTLKEPITKEQMDTVLQGNHLVNYFSYSSAYQDLLKSGHISLEERGGKQLLVLNKFGRDTALLLKSSLPLSVRDKVVSAGMELLTELQRDKEREVNIDKTTDGFTVRLRLHDGELELLHVNVFAPDEEQAELIRQQFTDHTAEIYKGMIALATRDGRGLRLLADDLSGGQGEQ